MNASQTNIAEPRATASGGLTRLGARCGFRPGGRNASADRICLSDRETKPCAALTPASWTACPGSTPRYAWDAARIRSTLLPGARSIISLGLELLSCGRRSSSPTTGASSVARYAQGRDYHRVMKRRMRRSWSAGPDHPALQLGRQRFAARWYVDDGPMLDRAVASRAGLGWFGKNGNILNPTYGSWLLLGQIVTNLELEPNSATVQNLRPMHSLHPSRVPPTRSSRLMSWTTGDASAT